MYIISDLAFLWSIWASHCWFLCFPVVMDFFFLFWKFLVFLVPLVGKSCCFSNTSRLRHFVFFSIYGGFIFFATYKNKTFFESHLMTILASLLKHRLLTSTRSYGHPTACWIHDIRASGIKLNRVMYCSQKYSW